MWYKGASFNLINGGYNGKEKMLEMRSRMVAKGGTSSIKMPGLPVQEMGHLQEKGQ